MIDLDVAVPEPVSPQRWRPSRWTRAAGAGALLLTLGAAAPADHRSPGVRETAHVDGAFLLTESTLYTVGSGDRPEIVAQPLQTGGVAWRHPVNSADAAPLLGLVGSMLLVSMGLETVVLDTATGEELLRTPDSSYAVVAGDKLLVTSEDGDLSLVDPAAPRDALWTVPGAAPTAEVDPAGRWVLSMAAGGMAVVRSMADGRELTRRNLAESTDTALTVAPIVGDLVLLIRPRGLSAYRLPDLTPLWRVPGTGAHQAVSCGDLICLTGMNGMTALDPASGRMVWTAPEYLSFEPLGSNAQSVVIDPVSGQVVEAGVPAARGLAITQDSRVNEIDLSSGWTVRELGQGGVAGPWTLRISTEGVVVTEAATGELRGVLQNAVPSFCSTAGRFLACPDAAGGHTVWEIGS
ncbi:PQQ-binding-like beta-propeller repeat protein [Actinoplanes rectilineatus]|uniref:outer membrane protein assembly factor BamB family protein n=1 Tax=Actinoplanes rectilineatus TaxID=113571 RepID=UPI0005F2C7F3|nr:PQQ-binding-like beta-propeller repeat protein [Actinoplanes rectilineatus]